MIIFFYWSFFVLDSFFFSSVSIWFCFVYILNMVLILLIVVFFLSILSLNILFHFFFFSRFSPYFFNCSFLILFLICFLSILSLGILFLLFFNPILVLSFFISFSYFMYRLSPLLFSFISFYTRFGHHYFDYYLFSS